jgi:hypothetical protein
MSNKNSNINNSRTRTSHPKWVTKNLTISLTHPISLLIKLGNSNKTFTTLGNTPHSRCLIYKRLLPRVNSLRQTISKIRGFMSPCMVTFQLMSRNNSMQVKEQTKDKNSFSHLVRAWNDSTRRSTRLQTTGTKWTRTLLTIRNFKKSNRSGAVIQIYLCLLTLKTPIYLPIQKLRALR